MTELETKMLDMIKEAMNGRECGFCGAELDRYIYYGCNNDHTGAKCLRRGKHYDDCPAVRLIKDLS